MSKAALFYSRALADEIGMTSEERHELAEFVFGVDGGSWVELDSKQLHDLATMLEGVIFVTFLRSARGSA